MSPSSRTQPAWRTLLYILSVFHFMTVALGAGPIPTTKATSTSSSSSSVSASKTSSATKQTHTINVGNGDHKFSPDTVRAKVGDIIEFDFFPPNHSVVRAEYKFPCIPYEMTGENKVGFFSGFHPVSTVQDYPPKFSIRVNDTQPVFFYCSAPGSCINYGMVGVINPNASTYLDTQRQMAQGSSYMLQPGEPFPAEGSASPNPSPSSNHSSKLSTGTIVGIAIASVSLVVVGCLLFFFWGRFRGLEDEMKRKDSTVVRNTSPRSPAFTNPHHPSYPRSPCAQTPTTVHTMPTASHPTSPNSQLQPNPIPPAYFTSHSSAHLPQPAHAVSVHDYAAAGGERGQLSRHESTRSVGGTFDLSPTTGYYTRTHNGADAYKYTSPHTSDMTSPVDPKIIPVGPYGRQMQDLQRLNRSPVHRSPSASTQGSPAPGYFEVVNGSGGGGGGGGAKGGAAMRPPTVHVNQTLGPAEMADTSVPHTTFI